MKVHPVMNYAKYMPLLSTRDIGPNIGLVVKSTNKYIGIALPIWDILSGNTITIWESYYIETIH